MLTSIRKPKRLIIRGDDEKDHMFLVKGGEDLRLDQRIEQVSGELGLESSFRRQLTMFGQRAGFFPYFNSFQK